MNRWTIAAAAFSVALATPSFAEEDGRNRKDTDIQGVWIMQVTLRHCVTGAALLESFPAINTFHEGGTLTEHGSRMPPAARNTGQGVWKKLGRDRYSSRFLFQRFDPNGLYIGTQQVSRRILFADDGTLQITARVKIIDASGAVMNEGCATEVGERF
jgi:hypothetical protein